jgi:two-component system chemotaxis response regulator CheY
MSVPDSADQLKVLIVDDDATLRRIIRLTLGRTSYQIVEAFDGVEALRLVDEEQPDLVVLDLSLPNVDGYTVCRKVKERPDPDGVRVIMLTAHSGNEVRERALSVGADGFLTKPFSPLALVHEIDRLLDTKGSDT